jgi:shikimate kinase
MNVVLCGMMGVGKTTVGRCLAQSLDLRWMDTDEYIVEKYGEISGIFERFGEGYFRALETEVVKELVQEDGLVISVGGGLVLKEENIDLLKQNGKIIYLRARVETLAERLTADGTRPLLKTDGESLTEKIEKILTARAPIYESVADFTVDVDGKEPEKIVGEIIAIMGIKY